MLLSQLIVIIFLLLARAFIHFYSLGRELVDIVDVQHVQ